MPSSVELVCVDPKRIAEFWPHARQLIKTAIEKTDLSDFRDIEYDVLSGDQLLWLAWSGSIEAAATTHLSRGVCTVTACAGHNRERWLPLLDMIEAYAAAEGCKCIRAYGRRGWERVLNGYKTEYVILEKAL
jgi:hypothetical protein